MWASQFPARLVTLLRRVTGLRAPGGRAARDEGSAVVEFTMMGVLILLPLVYLVLTMARLQAGAFAASLASREAGRAFVTAVSDADGAARAEAAAALSFGDFGFDSDAGVSLACTAEPCLSPEGRVTTTATVTVPLPLIPDFIRDAVPASVTLSATAVSSVDRFAVR